MISRIVRHVEYRRRCAKYPYIVESGVSHPNLIHPTAKVVRTNLSGPVKIAEMGRIEGPVLILGDVTIGRYTNINGPGTDIFCEINSVIIGAFCSIARHVAIQEFNHPVNRCSSSYALSNIFGDNCAPEINSKGSIEIGNDVWIGTQCVILPGSCIGSGAIIGANSVVNSEIPPYAIAVGSPAKVIKYRFPEPIVERLLALEWWNWPYERILQNRPLFEGELTIEKLNAVL